MKTFDPSWRLGLERMGPLLAELGHPETNLTIIQVAGTNGKGSVSYLTAGLLSAVTRGAVGLYTSPHLEKLAERFMIIEDGKLRQISQTRVEQALNRVSEAATKLPLSLGSLTEFEAWTLAAALLFKEAGISTAVFEVGLGGRLDATTALPAKLAVLCPISYDHQDRLGSDLASIAGEKAAIIRVGQPVVVSEQQSEAASVIQARAAEQQARLIPVTGRYRIVQYTASGTEFDWISRHGENYRFTLGLKGSQQVMNVACSLLAVEELLGPDQLTEQSSYQRAGSFLAEARWPGRFELLLHEGQRVLLDVGHNPQAVELFLQNLRLYFPDIPIWGVYGSLRDKDYRTAVSLISGYPFRGLVITEPWSDRKLKSDELAHLFSPSMQMVIESDLEKAVDLGVEKARADGALLAVFGSFFLVGPVRSKVTQGVCR